MSQPPHLAQRTKDNPFDVTKRERLLVIGSVFGAVIFLLVLGLVFDSERTLVLLRVIPASFFALGKFLPIVAVTGLPGFYDASSELFSTYDFGLVIWIMDSMTVLLIVYSLEVFYKIPMIGRFLDRANKDAACVLHAFPKFRRISRMGIVLFVLFPVAGTGAIGGSLIGAILGLNRFWLMLCVSFGGFVGGIGMSYATTNFTAQVRWLQAHKGDPLYLILTAIVIVGILAWSTVAFRRALAKARRQMDEEQAESHRLRDSA
jgi:uncharacterized membrane protein